MGRLGSGRSSCAPQAERVTMDLFDRRPGVAIDEEARIVITDGICGRLQV